MNFIAPRAEPLIREIPLSRLALAPENVRKTPPDSRADAELKASIAALGLLENLVVRADESGEDGTDRYAVVAGGRRLAEVAELSDLPVIFISGYGRDETIARAFEAGAADYIVKPFSETELTARVGAALRARAGAEPFELGALAIDYDRHRVTVDGRGVALTATEYEILRILSVNAGRMVTSESLLRQAWDSREPTDTERVRAFVKQIRAKLGDDAANPIWIFNERGVGYRVAKPGEE